MRLGLATLGLSATLLGCAAAREAQSPEHVPDRLAFALPDLRGKIVHPEDLRGQVVLVDLWATWCKPCKESLPFYAGLVRRYGKQGFAVLAISVDEDDEVVTAAVEKAKLPFTVLRDPRSTLPASLELQTMPTLLLLDRQGRVAFVHGGFEDGDDRLIEKQVRELVAASAPR